MACFVVTKILNVFDCLITKSHIFYSIFDLPYDFCAKLSGTCFL